MDQSIFTYLLSNPGNNACFECGAKLITCASVNNAIFLCKQCGEAHKQLPESISKIKNIQSDTWSDLEVDLLINGGNKRIWDLFAYYNMPRDQTFDYKYKTKIGCYYRFMLMAIVKGEDPGSPPEPYEALLLGTEQTKKRDDKASDEFWKALGFYTAQGVDYTKKTISDVIDTVSDPQWQTRAATGLVTAGVKVGVTLIDAAVETKKFIDNTEKDARENGSLNTAIDLGEKGLKYTVKGISSAVGFVSKSLNITNKKEIVYVNPNQQQPVQNQPTRINVTMQQVPQQQMSQPIQYQPYQQYQAKY
eukprot:CAMPEP_0176428090 /NCGR_PEP_ID=MMETSP0127-20121128/12954_1 /TAXON_ID=938130 /ORGANISM="Platyophrya macrostoma, Strain WH" /LENGTH=304 /DNA_ID=CAMNT_0017809729 /DNA_START=28 /DNA_END=942 /DNA_ORIENTATION=-